MAESNTLTYYTHKIWHGMNKKIFFPVLKIFRKKYISDFEDLSFITSNCIGGVLSHAYALKFNSPTVNLFMTAKDYVSFAENLEENLRASLNCCETNRSRGYPIGKVGDITLNFVHYQNFETAKRKWMERAARVDLSRVVLILCERDGCTPRDVEHFAKLPYRKIFLAKNNYPYDFVLTVQPTRYEKRNHIDPMDRLMEYDSFGKRRFEKYITPKLLINLAQKGK